MLKLPHIIALISHTSKVMLKILQARLQQYLSQEFPDVQAGFRKGRQTRDQIANNWRIIEKAREFPQNLFLLHWLCQSIWLWKAANCGKFLKRWECQTTLPASWETRMQEKKQQLEQSMEQWTGSKLEKEYIKAVYCHPAYLTCLQSTSSENLDVWHKVESRLLGEISITSDMQMIPPLG